MTEEEKYALNAGVEIIKEVAPQFYEDGLHPAVKQIGGFLEDTAKTFRLITLPIMLGRVGFDRFNSWCKRLSAEVDEEDMQEAQPNILLPTLASLAINPDETLLGEMFFNILKSSIDKTKQKFLSPAFPKILEQLSKDEAVMLVLLKNKPYSLEVWEEKSDKVEEEILIDIKTKKLFFGSGEPCKQTIKHNEFEDKKMDFQDQFYFYCNHLITLNIIECIEINRDISQSNDGLLIRYAQLRLTKFGQNFANACISPKCEEFI